MDQQQTTKVRKTRTGKAVSAKPDTARLYPILSEQFSGHGGEERAKRFRVNAAHSATAARDILSLLDASIGPGHPNAPAVEREFLVEVVAFFDGLNRFFSGAQSTAHQEKVRSEREWKQKREAQIAAAAKDLFGDPPDATAVFEMAQSLLAFDKDGGRWLADRHHADRGSVPLDDIYAIRDAVRQKDARNALRAIAIARIDMDNRGRLVRFDDEVIYRAGWEDFTAFNQMQRSSEKGLEYPQYSDKSGAIRSL